MLRDGKSTVPFALMAFLWGSVAAWVHLGLGIGGYEVGVTHDDHKSLVTFTEKLSNKIDRLEPPTEIAIMTDSTATAPPVPTAPPTAKREDEQKKPELPPEKKAEEKKKQPEPEKKVAVVEKKKAPEEKKPAAPLQQVQPDKRIAVRQHADPNQQDNPDAHFIANEANHVKKETVAQLTSHDRDDQNPTPAKAHSGTDPDQGDSDKNKVAEADEHLGEERKAPGERGMEYDIQHDPRPVEASALHPVNGPRSQVSPRSGGDGQPAPSQNEPQLAPGNMAPPSPNVVSNDDSGWSFNIARTPGSGDSSATGPGSVSRKLEMPSSSHSDRAFGLGGNPGPGQVNLNLDNKGVVAVVGADELRRERESDGERRRSEHRGVFTASNFERWRSAIENYVSSVRPGNQTALNTAAVPFATYLNGMHNRIHPIFADSFLAGLDNLPPTHALNDQHLVTRLEIVLSRDGHVVKMGVVKTSGVTAFDIAALDSVQRASPFGPAPSAIVSTDGQVYLHWEFHRDEVYACSTMNARPYMLNVQPSQQGPAPGPIHPAPGPQERLPTNTREGMNALPLRVPSTM